jgi:thiamine-phosphate pyrophosphorylase
MLVTDRAALSGRSLEDVVELAVDAGVHLVQLREKDLEAREYAELARSIAHAIGDRATLLLNGHPDLAQQLGCGLHLPADAAGPQRPARPFGRSVHNAHELAAAIAEDVDYVVAGNLFDTGSKSGRPGRGLAWLEDTCRAAWPVRVFAIGGVDAARVHAILDAGAWGVAVRSAIVSSPSPDRASRGLVRAVLLASGAASDP